MAVMSVEGPHFLPSLAIFFKELRVADGLEIPQFTQTRCAYGAIWALVLCVIWGFVF